MHITTQKVILGLSVAVAIETAIGGGTVSLTNAIPALWIPTVEAWCGIGAFVGSTVIAALAGNSAFGTKPTVQSATDAANVAPAGAAVKVIALFAVLILGSMLVPQARAADALPVPAAAVAPVTAPCSPTSCTGFYIGANLTGVMTNANIVGNGINGSVAGGGQSIGGQLGYQFANGTWFFGPEFDFDYTVGGTAPDGGSAPTYLFGEYLKIGTSLATLFGIQAPTTGTPGIPAALANAVISPYLIFGAAQRNWGTGWATGAGVEFALSGHWFVDTRYTYINYGSANVTATETAKSENLVTIGFNYKF